MPKYYYKPILSIVSESYLENAKKEYAPPVDIETSVNLVVEAETEEASYETLYGFVDIRMWEIDKVED